MREVFKLSSNKLKRKNATGFVQSKSVGKGMKCPPTVSLAKKMFPWLLHINSSLNLAIQQSYSRNKQPPKVSRHSTRLKFPPSVFQAIHETLAFSQLDGADCSNVRSGKWGVRMLATPGGKNTN